MEYEDQFDDGELDEMVHDLKGLEAAAVNNGGVKEQLKYIFEALGKSGARVELDKLLE